MKKTIHAVVAALVILGIAASSAFAGDPPKGEKDTRPVATAFDRLKALAGQWEGKTADGKGGLTTYKVASNNSAVVEEMDHSSMITVFHLDGDRLMLTHYCGATNQPRMRTAPITSDGDTLKFDFVDVTNLKSPDAGCMKSLVLKFKDVDHFTATWTYSENDKVMPMEIQYTRKK